MQPTVPTASQSQRRLQRLPKELGIDSSKFDVARNPLVRQVIRDRLRHVIRTDLLKQGAKRVGLRLR